MPTFVGTMVPMQTDITHFVSKNFFSLLVLVVRFNPRLKNNEELSVL